MMGNFFDSKSYEMTEEYNSLSFRIDELEKQVQHLTEVYSGVLGDIKHLEEENIETTNVLYEIMEDIRAVDARIDIVTSEKWGE